MTPLRWTAVSAVVNIIGDYLLCVVFPLGVAGAAWATLASQAVMLTGLLSSLSARRLLPKLWPLPTPALLAPFAAFAGPVSVLALIRVAGFTALAAHANGLGDAAALAAHQISVSVLVLLSICGEPLNATGQTRLPRLYPGGAAPDARAASALVRTLVRAAMAGEDLEAVIGGRSDAQPAVPAGREFERVPRAMRMPDRTGAVFFFKDQGSTKRTLYALGVRITLAVLLMITITYGIFSGQLQLNAPWHGGVTGPTPAATQP
jgi:hypothetical protein